jgi:Raf kinase inhibitor-like YbhB/YbcL family protein
MFTSKPTSISILRRGASSLAAVCAVALSPAAHAFDVTSADMRDHGTLSARQVLNGFGCTGGDTSPQLAWSDPPAGTQSFAVTLYDPDAPTGSGWWHWVVYDIPADVRSLPAGAGAGAAAADGKSAGLPAGARHGRNEFGTYRFGGACPPAGDKPHRYVVTVTALKVAHLPLPAEPSGAMVGFMVGANRLGSATLTATYGR